MTLDGIGGAEESSAGRIIRLSVTAHFRLRLQASGKISRQPLPCQHHCLVFSATLRLNFLRDPTQMHNLHPLIVVLRIITFYLYRDLEVRLNYTSR